MTCAVVERTSDLVLSVWEIALGTNRYLKIDCPQLLSLTHDGHLRRSQGQGQQAVVFSDRGQMFQFFIDFFEL